jgi:hypothetical protein
VRRLEQGGYFVYPGSPVPITKRETGQRKVNLFELGKPPREYPLDTPYFEEVVVVCDPFVDKSPLDAIKERFDALPQNALAILTVTGFINGATIGMTEEELVEGIKKIVRDRRAEPPNYEFRDIRTILEDDLFKGFLTKLEQAGHADEKKKQMREIAIRAMMGARR